MPMKYLTQLDKYVRKYLSIVEVKNNKYSNDFYLKG